MSKSYDSLKYKYISKYIMFHDTFKNMWQICFVLKELIKRASGQFPE